ncbi:MAG: hypothetical protein ACLR6O_00800 [Eubacterium sp.]
MKNINDKNIKRTQNSNINIDELKAAAQSGNAEQYISRALPKDASDKIKKSSQIRRKLKNSFHSSSKVCLIN